jgi:hypothetical protein
LAFSNTVRRHRQRHFAALVGQLVLEGRRCPGPARDLDARISTTSVAQVTVSPMKVGLGVTTLSKPRLAMSVPTVVSAIDRPTARLNVKRRIDQDLAEL